MDDATGGISGAQPTSEPPKPVTKLKLHFGGGGGTRMSMQGAALDATVLGLIPLGMLQ